MNPSRYIVIYKDSPKALNIYFGPFVSVALCESVLAELPEPLSGGSKTYKQLSRFSSWEMHVAHKMILDIRQSIAA